MTCLWADEIFRTQLIEPFRDEMRYRKGIHTLNELTDHQLKDIGISRGAIQRYEAG